MHEEFPIFVLGSGRSGTTLLQRILNALPHVAISGEHGGFLAPLAEAYFERLLTGETAQKVTRPDRVGVAYEHFVSKLREPERWPAWEQWWDREDCAKHFRGLVENFFRPPPAVTMPHWGFKEIRYGAQDRTLDFLRDLFPQARILFIVRAPNHTVASQSALGWGDADCLADRWVSANRRHERMVRGDSLSYLVRYEDLIDPSRDGLRELFDWLGFELSEDCRNVLAAKRGRFTTVEAVGQNVLGECLSAVDRSGISTRTAKVSWILGYSVPRCTKESDRQPIVNFSWRGVDAPRTKSMGLVNVENIKALEDLGWRFRENVGDADVRFSFFHQENVKPDTSGAKRIFYICTTYHNSLTKNAAKSLRVVSEADDNYVFVLNREMQRNYMLAGVRTYIWHHGVDLARFSPKPEEEGKFTFGFVGWPGMLKRSDFLIDCFSKAFGKDPKDVRLRLLSTPRSLNGKSGIEFVERQQREEIQAFFQSLDCYVTFSHGEGYTLPVLEALACGIPCLVTDMPCMHEYPGGEQIRFVPSRIVDGASWYNDEAFAPNRANAYVTPPAAYEVSTEAAVEGLRSCLENPMRRRSSALDDRYSWRGRIETQVLPVIRNELEPRRSTKRGAGSPSVVPWSGYEFHVPVPRVGFEFSEIGDSRYQIRGVKGQLVELNAISAAIWGALDGRRTVGDIIDSFSRDFDTPRHVIMRDVDNILDEFLGLGAVMFR